MEKNAKPARVALIVCVGAFVVAMGLRETLNLWIGTGVAALTSAILVWLGAPATMHSALHMPTLRSVTIGAAVGIAMSLLTWWLYPISVAVFPPIQVEVQTLYGLLRQPPGPIRAFPLLVFVVAAEELVWRGLAIDLFAEALGPWRTVLVAALLYVLPQVAFRSPLLMVVALLCGVLWGSLRVRSGDLAAPFTAHLVWDILVFVMYPVA